MNEEKYRTIGFLTQKAQDCLDSESGEIVVLHYDSGNYETEIGSSFESAVSEIVEELIQDSDKGRDELTEEAERVVNSYDISELEKAYEGDESWPVDLGYIEEREVTERAYELYRHDLNWYVCHTEDGEFEVVHSIHLSEILQCGRNPSECGYTKIERCWNWENLFQEDDFN